MTPIRSTKRRPQRSSDMIDRSGEPWIEVDVEKLAKLYFTSPRIHVDKIALALGRTTGAVQTEVSRLGMAQPGAKLRICLGEVCGGRRRFFSSAPGNRICQRCAKSEVYRCAS